MPNLPSDFQKQCKKERNIVIIFKYILYFADLALSEKLSLASALVASYFLFPTDFIQIFNFSSSLSSLAFEFSEIVFLALNCIMVQNTRLPGREVVESCCNEWFCDAGDDREGKDFGNQSTGHQ